MQEAGLDAPVMLVVNPGRHDVQLLMVTAPCAMLYVPIGHGMHAAELEDPDAGL